MATFNSACFQVLDDLMVALKLTPPKNAPENASAAPTPVSAAGAATAVQSSEENKENLGSNGGAIEGSNPGEVICSQPTSTTGVKSDGDSSSRDDSTQQPSSQDVEMSEGS